MVQKTRLTPHTAGMNGENVTVKGGNTFIDFLPTQDSIPAKPAETYKPSLQKQDPDHKDTHKPAESAPPRNRSTTHSDGT